jgi:hypothetical protein
MSSRSESDGDEHIQRVLPRMEHFLRTILAVSHGQHFVKQRFDVPPWS